MIADGWAIAHLAVLSPAQLIWIHAQKKRREIKNEIRQLLIWTAAVNTGTNGGDAAAERLRLLQGELNSLATGNNGRDGVSPSQMNRTPRSAEEFAAMMADVT